MPPQPLAHTSATVLEFDALRELLCGYAPSSPGKNMVMALAPSRDSRWIQNQQQLTTEVREFRRVGGGFDFSGLTTLSQILEKSRISGAALEIDELREVIRLVERASEWREIAQSPPAAM